VILPSPQKKLILYIPGYLIQGLARMSEQQVQTKMKRVRKTSSKACSLSSLKKIVSGEQQLSRKKKKLLFAFFEFIVMDDEEEVAKRSSKKEDEEEVTKSSCGGSHIEEDEEALGHAENSDL